MRTFLPVLLLLTTTTALAEPCTIDHCHDGDTCTLICGMGTDTARRVKVRLYCIDAPEIAQTPWGKLSRDNLHRMADAGDVVDLEAMTRDRYGRTVGVIYRQGVNLNLEQVKSGSAAVYPRYCSDQQFYSAQDSAKGAHKGIWSEQGAQQTPWEWRRQ